ncbi:MAG: potassium channel family protein [Candidatus Cyclobacteriaceae bacterium M2_1C_046]
MNFFYLLIGIVITIWAIIEGLWTTIWVDGNSAPLTSRLTTVIWKGFRLFVSKKSHRILSLAGPVILFLTVVIWISLILFGWSFIFYSFEDSLTNKDNTPVDFSDVFWYIGYCMFTVGNGDSSPNGSFWQIASTFVAMSGMLIVTLSVTYILQVISAVVNKRSFANQVISIGKTPEEFVCEQWNGDGFGAIELQMVSLTGKLSTLTEQHLAYPILNYYHAAQYENSVAVAVAIYDDALTIISKAVPEKHHPPTTILTSGRRTIDSFIKTLKAAFIEASEESPPQPNLDKIRKDNIPIESEEVFNKALKDLEQRRKLLYGAIKNDAWHWPK